MTWWKTHRAEMDVLLLPMYTRGTTGSLMEKGHRTTATTHRLLTSTIAIAMTTMTVVDTVNARATTGTHVSPAAFHGRPRVRSMSV